MGDDPALNTKAVRTLYGLTPNSSPMRKTTFLNRFRRLPDDSLDIPKSNKPRIVVVKRTPFNSGQGAAIARKTEKITFSDTDVSARAGSRSKPTEAAPKSGLSHNEPPGSDPSPSRISPESLDHETSPRFDAAPSEASSSTVSTPGDVPSFLEPYGLTRDQRSARSRRGTHSPESDILEVASPSTSEQPIIIDESSDDDELNIEMERPSTSFKVPTKSSKVPRKSFKVPRTNFIVPSKSFKGPRRRLIRVNVNGLKLPGISSQAKMKLIKSQQDTMREELLEDHKFTPPNREPDCESSNPESDPENPSKRMKIVEVDRRKNFHWCLICPAVFKTRAEQQTHRTTHLGRGHEKSVACNLCHKTFKFPYLLLTHINQEHVPEENLPFQCDICDIGFALRGNRDKHMAIHADDRPRDFECTFHQAGFSSKKEFAKHLTRVHKMDDNVDRFFCVACGEYFTKDTEYIDHVEESHPEDPEFLCRNCNEIFKDVPTFITHNCTMRARYKGSNRQKRTNLLEDADGNLHALPPLKPNNPGFVQQPMFPFKCCHCGSLFQRPTMYIRHMQKKHGESDFAAIVGRMSSKPDRPASPPSPPLEPELGALPGGENCDACKAGFRTHERFKKHMRLHAKQLGRKRLLGRSIRGHSKFQCPLCARHFANHDDLQSHRQEKGHWPAALPEPAFAAPSTSAQIVSPPNNHPQAAGTGVLDSRSSVDPAAEGVISGSPQMGRSTGHPHTHREREMVDFSSGVTTPVGPLSPTDDHDLNVPEAIDLGGAVIQDLEIASSWSTDEFE